MNDDSDKIQSMVDLHAAYLENDTDENMPWPSTDPVERIAIQYSMPDFLVRAWVDEYGVDETQQLCRISNEPGPITLRRNAILCCSDEILIERLRQEEGVELSSRVMEGCLRITSLRPKSIWAMDAWKDGWFEVQDVGSQYIVAATEVGGNDEVVIDYCAGNGGKTLAILSRLHSQGSSATVVWAHDIVDMRLAQLRGSLARAGVHLNNSTVQLFTTLNADEHLSKDMADVVLVDAPCSSCGVLRRRPSHRWELTQYELEDTFPRLQLEILRNASRLVKQRGRLIYATCSICHTENENVASKWEKEAGDSWEPWPFDYHETPPHGGESHYCKLLPHKHDSDGFFIARWKRRKIE
jgi:16S rRNA (cytosine967-C5)-methyltransferase